LNEYLEIFKTLDPIQKDKLIESLEDDEQKKALRELVQVEQATQA